MKRATREWLDMMSWSRTSYAASQDISATFARQHATIRKQAAEIRDLKARLAALTRMLGLDGEHTSPTLRRIANPKEEWNR